VLDALEWPATTDLAALGWRLRWRFMSLSPSIDVTSYRRNEKGPGAFASRAFGRTLKSTQPVTDPSAARPWAREAPERGQQQQVALRITVRLL